MRAQEEASDEEFLVPKNKNPRALEGESGGEDENGDDSPAEDGSDESDQGGKGEDDGEGDDGEDDDDEDEDKIIPKKQKLSDLSLSDREKMALAILNKIN